MMPFSPRHASRREGMPVMRLQRNWQPGWGGMLRRCALLAGGLLLAAHTAAQQPSLRTFGQLDGLGNMAVMALAQDLDGYLWVGTENGLYRYDGSRFRHFGRAEGLSEGHVTALHVDPAGRLWVATERGVSHFDGKRLVALQRADGRPLGVRTGQHLASLAPDLLLVQATGRLMKVRLSGAAGSWRAEPMFAEDHIQSQPELRDLNGILAESDGTLWMGCKERLCRYRGGRVEVLGAPYGLPQDRWFALRRDRAGTLWLASHSRVMALEAGAQRFRERGPDGVKQAETGFPVPLIEDADGRMVGATSDGLFLLAAGSWRRIGPEQGLHTSSAPSALLRDRDGDLWLGLAGRGLVQWQGYRHWENWTAAQGLPEDEVWSFLRTRDGTLHVGTSGGAAALHEGRRRFAAAPAGTLGGGKPWGSIVQDAQGNLWMGSFAGSLVRRDGRTGQGRVIAELGLTIFQMLFDGAGQLWICTDRGLYLIAEPERAPVARLVEQPGALLKVESASASVTGACRDASGQLWFAGGPGLLKLAGGQWSRAALVGDDHAFDSVVCDGDTLWVLDGDHGRIWRLDTKAAQPALRPFNLDVLNGRLIQSMLVDRRHWLWLGTDAGLMVWNGSRWRAFTQRSGMVWNDTSQNALYEDRDGSIWIGTSNGATHVLQPEALFGAARIPLLLDSMQYGDAKLAGAGYTAPWSGEALNVVLAAPMFQNHEAITFRYRLEGGEPHWSSSANGEIRYAALAPGRYKLQVSAEHGALQATSALMEVPVEISPPWWKTRLFYAACALLAAILIGALHRYRVAYVLRRQALLEARVAERTAVLEASREEHRLRALTDGLTKAWNRVAVMERLAALVAGESSFIVVLLDLDHFKRINDTHGHLAGDAVLKELVQRLQAQVRASDTVGRYGGEEFVLLLPELDPDGGADRLGHLHRAIGGKPFDIGGGEMLAVTCSCGVAVGRPGMNLTPEQWLDLADKALYRAKANGRNRIEFA